MALVPAQEFAVRGALQGSLETFFEGPRRAWIAIVMSNILFSVVHVHLSMFFAAVTFVVGVFWGWLCYRHRSLVGACVSHLVLGLAVFFLYG